MVKSAIKRQDFNHNFLMNGIIRLDYSGVIDIEDVIIKDLTNELRKSNYTESDESFINELSFKLIDPIKIETLRSVPLEEFVKNKSYKFRNPTNNNIIEITKFFITLTIDYSKGYNKFDDYVILFTNIVKILKEKYLFIRPLRIGERKINSLFIYDENSIHNYFEPPYFIYPIPSKDILDKPSEWVIHNSVDTLQFGNLSVNITRNMSKGKLKNEKGENPVSRLLFDIDCYSSGRSALFILNGDDLEKRLVEFNDLGFNLYKNSLTCDFIQKLTSNEEFNDGNLFGVRRQ